MGASVNANADGSHVGPSQGGGEGEGGGGSGGASGGNPANGTAGGAAVAAVSTGASGTAQALKHNPGLSLEWSAEEQAILEEGLAKFASDTTLVRYTKIAILLQNKTVRDVALRCRYMTKKESGKRRKDEGNLSKKSKDKKERVTDPSSKPSAQLGPRPNVPPYALPTPPVDDDDISYKAIGGRTGQMLESNSDALSKISSNLANLKIQDNIKLFCDTRDNILSILKDLSDMPEIMKQMPPLPVKINEELANSILPRISMPMQT